MAKEPGPDPNIDSLSKNELRQRYKSTYSSWRNMKFRSHSSAVIDPAFEQFESFLRHVGPRPPGHTLDRIDPSNPTYGPGLVQWADARGQANNRGRTIFLNVNGERHPLTIWADKTKQHADTLRARRKKGWNDRDVVFGREEAALTGALNPFLWKPWNAPGERRFQEWEERYNKEGNFGELPIDFFIRRLREVCIALQNEMEEMADVEDEYTPTKKFLDVWERHKLLHQKHMWAKDKRSAMKPHPKPANWVGPSRFHQISRRQVSTEDDVE